MTQQLICTLLMLAAASLARAHFIFVVPDPGAKTAKVFISEDLKPDESVDVGLVAGAKLNLRGAGGSDTSLMMTKASDAYQVALDEGTRLVYGVVDLGLTQRGASAKPHLLIYYPKTIVGNALGGDVTLGGKTPVELVPVGEPGALRLRLLTRGRPAANAEITVIMPDGTQKKVTTDDSGETEVFAQTGRFGAWARFWEPATGERDGKKYEELRHYATLVFDAPDSATSAEKRETGATRLASLPWAASSFGAVADGAYLYVYGGHVARMHSYSTDAVSGQFQRMSLSAPGKWEQLPGGPGLQGMNLAAHDGKIYRIGGMEPRNAPGTPADNHSIADAVRFDPAAGKWETLPSMPEPRSSHDIVVIGDTLIVTGGWNLRGKTGTKWSDTILTLDLAADKLEWKSAAQPFKRRALIASAYSGRMFVMGGIDEGGKVSADVDIYDPKTGSWSKGPSLPGTGTNTFAPAACVHEGRLYVSLADGGLYRLNDSAGQWEEAGRATARIAHRIVANGKTVLVIGGSKGGNNLDLIESIEPGQGSVPARSLARK